MQSPWTHFNKDRFVKGAAVGIPLMLLAGAVIGALDLGNLFVLLGTALMVLLVVPSVLFYSLDGRWRDEAHHKVTGEPDD